MNGYSIKYSVTITKMNCYFEFGSNVHCSQPTIVLTVPMPLQYFNVRKIWNHLVFGMQFGGQWTTWTLYCSPFWYEQYWTNGCKFWNDLVQELLRIQVLNSIPFIIIKYTYFIEFIHIFRFIEGNMNSIKHVDCFAFDVCSFSAHFFIVLSVDPIV